MQALTGQSGFSRFSLGLCLLHFRLSRLEFFPSRLDFHLGILQRFLSICQSFLLMPGLNLAFRLASLQLAAACIELGERPSGILQIFICLSVFILAGSQGALCSRNLGTRLPQLFFQARGFLLRLVQTILIQA